MCMDKTKTYLNTQNLRRFMPCAFQMKKKKLFRGNSYANPHPLTREMTRDARNMTPI